jgi:RNA polymerase sigma-70 factor (ECF subfamily)
MPPKALSMAVPPSTVIECAVPSFDSLYEKHFPFVWRSTRRLGVAESATDDVVQEIFLIVHRRLSSFEGRSSIRTWIYGIAVRVVRDHRRSLRRKPSEPADVDVFACERGTEDDVERAQAVRVLYMLLDRLDDEKREVFVLAELEQMSVPEIAEILGANTNTVYSRLRAARKDFEQAAARHRARDGWRMR